MAKNQNNNVAPATQKTDPGAKKDALATALAQIEKQFGKGAVMKLGDNAAMQVDAISTGSIGTATSYRVRTTADVLNIRKGPGTNYGVAGQIKGKGIYTIVAEAAGPGATKWGKLKSGAGWISLDYVTKL